MKSYNKVKKSLLSVMLVLVLTPSLVGCGAKKDGETYVTRCNYGH